MNSYLKKILLTMALIFSIELAISQSSNAEPLSKPEESLWSQSDPLQFTLEANFTLLRKKADGGKWDDVDWDDPKANKTDGGFLTIANSSNELIRVPVTVRARGRSSLIPGELEFPKLKVTVNKDDQPMLNETAFNLIKSFRINTHVTNNENINDPEQARTEKGRLRSENSPLREQSAIILARTLGLLTPNTRLASINYIEIPQNQSVVKKALLIESNSSIKKRLKGDPVSQEEFSKFKIVPVDPKEGALFHLFHKIIGNDDVGLHIYESSKMTTEKNRPLFNTELYHLPDGTYRPLVYDLDLSTWVSGFELLNPNFYQNHTFKFKDGNLSIMAHHLFALRMRIPHKSILGAIEKTKQLKSELYKVIEEARDKQHIDPLGYENAKAHLDSYFSVVDDVMKTPVFGSKKVKFYHDVKGTKSGLVPDPSTGEDSFLRIGTPIKIIEEVKGMYKVSIIDTAWDVNYNSSIGHGNPSTTGYIAKKDFKLIDFLVESDVGLLDGRDMF